jgi:hypothetical protein
MPVFRRGRQNSTNAMPSRQRAHSGKRSTGSIRPRFPIWTRPSSTSSDLSRGPLHVSQWSRAAGEMIGNFQLRQVRQSRALPGPAIRVQILAGRLGGKAGALGAGAPVSIPTEVMRVRSVALSQAMENGTVDYLLIDHEEFEDAPKCRPASPPCVGRVFRALAVLARGCRGGSVEGIKYGYVVVKTRVCTS